MSYITQGYPLYLYEHRGNDFSLVGLIVGWAADAMNPDKWHPIIEPGQRGPSARVVDTDAGDYYCSTSGEETDA